MSTAKVTIWDTTIGYLYWDDRNNTALFEAEKEYINAPFNIAPIIHRDKEIDLSGNDFHDKFLGLIPTFNDSLPDSFGNIVFKEWLEQMNIDQSKMNPIERLRYVGRRGVGALEYHEGKDIPDITHYLDLEELATISDKIVQKKYNYKDYLNNPEALQNILSIGSSVGGAQAKILVAITPDEHLLAGDIIHDTEVDYYIVKLEHDSKDVWNKEKNFVEYIYNQIATDIGINVAPSRLIHEGGRTHFASKRFDRIGKQRVHQQTESALTRFYGKNTEFSYENIFEIIEFLKLPYSHSEQLFMQMTYNVLASNRDDHTKNISFIMNPTGEWSLAPAYDLTFPFDPYQSFVIPHKISINNKTKDITRKDLESVAQKAGIRNFKYIIDNVVEQVATFETRIKQYDLNNKTIQLIVKDLEKNKF